MPSFSETSSCRRRIRFERDRGEEMFVDDFVRRLYLLGVREISFPKFPCEFLDRFLPGDRADDKAAVFVDIDRLKNVRATRDQIGREKKIFVKTESLRIDEIDLVLRSAGR